MKNVSLPQMRKDFNYIKDNIDSYLIDELSIFDDAVPKLQSGEIGLKEFMLASIEDIIHFAIGDEGCPESKEFI